MSETLIQEVDLGLIKGDNGEKGEQGEIGPQGPQGIQGEKGSKGDKGDRGEKGCKGEKGDKGDRGCKGEKGDKGDRGCKGEKGDKGDPGIIGPQGQQGKRGLKGDKGDRGERGAIGPQGEKGDTGTLNWCDIVGKPEKLPIDESTLKNYYTKTEIDNILKNLTIPDHDHNNKYYTKTQTDEFLANKFDKTGGDISGNIKVIGNIISTGDITAFFGQALKFGKNILTKLLPTGQISMSQVNAELGTTGQISLTEKKVRELGEKPTGQISMSDLKNKNSFNWRSTLTVEYMRDSYGFSSVPGWEQGNLSNRTFGNSTIRLFKTSLVSKDVIFQSTGTTINLNTRLLINNTVYKVDHIRIVDGITHGEFHDPNIGEYLRRNNGKQIEIALK